MKRCIMNIENTCCFTGKRPQSFSFGYNEYAKGCVRLKEKLKAEIENAIGRGYKNFISGMALGVDLWAAELVLELKKKYPEIELYCAIPYKGQSISWEADYRERYMTCIHKSKKYVVISPVYTKSCFFKRNMYMVDNSSLVIAVSDNPPTGGTAHTIDYAQRMGKEIKILEI